MFPELDQWAG